MSKKKLVILLIAGILILDQALKVWVKLTFNYSEEVQLLGSDRMLLHFVENDGMAFGFSFGGSYGKLILSLFRIGAVVFLCIYLYELVQRKTNWKNLIGFTLIQAGAIGNIIDSSFYGLLFSDSTPGSTATFLPEGGGYAPFLYGRVVDMFYFPLFYGNYAEWIPWLGGDSYLFFKPVFNVADVAITMGVGVLLYDQLVTVLGKRKQSVASTTVDREEE